MIWNTDSAIKKMALLAAFVMAGGVGLASAASASGLSAEQATQNALRVTGLGEQPDMKCSAKLETLSAADDVPFLKLAGRPVWRVSLSGVRLAVRDRAQGGQVEKQSHWEGGWRLREHKSIHDLAVLIDAADGKLIGIASPRVAAFESKRTEEQELAASSREYVGPPDTLTGFTFMQALQSVQEGYGGFLNAKRIKARYVLFKQWGTFDRDFDKPAGVSVPCRDEPCPMWVITYRGLPFWRPPKPGETVPNFATFRFYVDPTNGEYLGAEGMADRAETPP